mgnify:CR=1 FL=1
MNNSLLRLVACGFALMVGWAGSGAEGAVSKGLVLHYDFNNAEAPAVDRSGGGHDGEILGAQWIPVGIGGGAMHLRGPQDRIQATDAGLPFGDAPRSISWWVVLDSIRPGGVTDFIYYGNLTYNQMSIVAIDWRLDRDCPSFSQWGGVYLSGRRIVQPGVWLHLVLTYGGNGKYVYYINGERWHGYSELNGPIDTRPGGVFAIGSYNPDEIHSLDGYIDEIRVYDRAVSEEEVRALFREGASLANKPVGHPLADNSSAVEPPEQRESRDGSESKAAPVEALTTPMVQSAPPIVGGSTATEYPQILRIGFSNDPQGDRDVTVFLPDEVLHVWVEDVDIGPWNKNIQIRVTVSQRDDAGRILNTQTIELKPNEQQVFFGQVPLDIFTAGLVQVDIIGTDRDAAIVLMRSAWLRITAN